MIDSRAPWDYVVLVALRSGLEVDLSKIYDTIWQVTKEGSSVVNPELLETEPRWGERPKYYHSVRSAVSSLTKRKMIERISRGKYQITEVGRKRLKELENVV